MLTNLFHAGSRREATKIATFTRYNDVGQEVGIRQKQSLARYRQYARLVVLVVLTLIGLYALSTTRSKQATLSPQTTSAQTSHALPVPVQQNQQLQASTLKGSKDGQQASGEATFCNPLDVSCWLNQAAQWMAQNIFGVLQPLVDNINQSSLNFITQTPPAATYQNATVIQFAAWSLGVVDAAVAIFIVIAGYNIMIACQIGADYHDALEFLARLILAVLAANFSLFFSQMFIDLVNTLNLGVIDLFDLTILTNTIVGIFQGNIVGAGVFAFVLAVILGVMDLLLAWQMLVRLALLILLIILAPLAFLCGALRQTQGYLSLWSSTFAATVFVQFFQVSALAMGGMLLSYVVQVNLFNLGNSILSLVTGVGVLYLVIRLPGMLRVYALRPVAQAGGDSVRAAQGTVATVLRLIALA